MKKWNPDAAIMILGGTCSLRISGNKGTSDRPSSVYKLLEATRVWTPVQGFLKSMTADAESAGSVWFKGLESHGLAALGSA